MEVVDNHAEAMGSGLYCALAGELQAVANAMGAHTTTAHRVFATELIMDVPMAAAATGMVELMEDPEFVENLIQRKSWQLETYNRHEASIMGHAWKIELTNALTPHSDSSTLEDVRQGILVLLASSDAFLVEIVNRLNVLGITPRMFLPKDLGAAPESDDDQNTFARDFLYHEPRMLRWMLGMSESEPWPVENVGRDEHVNELIRFADLEGGDDPSINGEGIRVSFVSTTHPPGLDLPPARELADGEKCMS